MRIIEYVDTHYKGIHKCDYSSYALASCGLEHTHAYGGGRDNTAALLSIFITGKVMLTIPAIFPLAGKINGNPAFPAEIYETADDEKKTIIGCIHASEMWVILAKLNPKDCHCTFDILDDKDRAKVRLNVRGQDTIGKLTSSATIALARALAIGVGTIIQSQCDALAAEYDKAFTAELAAA